MNQTALPISIQNPTASGLARALACPASEVLPKVHTTSEHADGGQHMHAFVRKVVRGMPVEDAIIHVPDALKDRARRTDFATLTAGLKNIRSEQAFAIDTATQTVRFLGEDIGRRYPTLLDSEIAGTEDIGAELWDHKPITIDLKFGWEPVPDPDENAQTKFFAVRAHLATGANEVEGRIAYGRESGSIKFERHVFQRIEMEEYLDELDELPGRIAAARRQLSETGMVAVSPGRWCKYCAAQSSCPSKTGLARYLAGADLSTISAMLSAMTPEQQANAWEKAKEIKSIVETVIDGLQDVARREPFLTRGGLKEVREIHFPQDRFVNEKAIALLHELGATREQIDTCYVEHTITQVRELKAPGAPKATRKKKSTNLLGGL